VTHIPDVDVIEPSVRFLVSVAADELTLEYDIDRSSFGISSSPVDRIALWVRPTAMPRGGYSLLISHATHGSM
jgi:hypothetical protein